MKTRHMFVLLIFMFFHNAHGQSTDTTLEIQPERLHFRLGKRDAFARKIMVPVSLIAGGVAGVSAGKWDKVYLQENIRGRVRDFRTHTDDYIQYVPILQLYLFDALRLNSRHGVLDQSKYLLISQLANSLVVHSLKRLTHMERPNGGQHSFPSGHTSQAFVAATVLYREFKGSNPLLAGSGYLFAAATGMLRVVNDAHWVPDVLVGSGLGILITHFIYEIEPLQGWHPFQANNPRISTQWVPACTNGSAGLAFRISF